MSRLDRQRKDHETQLRNAVDNYQQTVLALKAFGNEILFDDQTRTLSPGGTAHCGRKLRTSANNRKSKEEEQKPDLVVQRSLQLATIAEAKLGFPTTPNEFEGRISQCLDQVEKYDDDLTGWYNAGGRRGTPAHDIVLLVNYEDAKRVERELRARREAGGFVVTRSFSVISIANIRRAGGVFWPELDLLGDGRLLDATKTEKLANRLPIHPEKLATNPQFGLAELYDCEPPEPLMMNLVWRGIDAILTQEQRDAVRFDGFVELTASLQEVCDLIRQRGWTFLRHDSRDVDVPDTTWVSRAIGRFVSMKWATRVEGQRESFRFTYKFRRSPYEQFVRFVAKRRAYADETARKKAERQEKASHKKGQAQKRAEAQREATRREREAKRMPLLENAIRNGTLKPRRTRKGKAAFEGPGRV